MGFVGLTLAVFLSSKNCKVIAIDKNKDRIAQLEKGRSPIFEPNLEESLRKIPKKSLLFSSTFSDLDDAEFVFVTVGTPSNDSGGISLKQIEFVCEQIQVWLKKKNHHPVIIIKSTVIPKTLESIVKPILIKSGKLPEKDFGLVSNPEFLREGNALFDTINPHAIVIGGEKESGLKLKHFYEKIYSKKIPIILTNSVNAELIKYANNAFLATKISFINTIANICQILPGTNVDEIAKAIGIDPRIGAQFLKAGPGYGGSCFPKDVRALIKFSKNNGFPPILLEATQKTNTNQINIIFNLMKKQLKKISGSTISILGLAFKENTSDIRESVSLELINILLKYNAKIKVHDPQAIKNTKTIFGDKIIYCTTVEQCLKDSDCAVVLTPWKEYTELNSEHFKKMKHNLVIDTRRIIPRKFSNIQYIGLGIG